MSMPMDEHTRLYIHEDVFTCAGRTGHYLPTQGNEWSFSPEFRYDLVGIFGQARPFGHWPRAVNLWEVDWRRLAGALSEQYGEAPPRRFEGWWQQSNVDRVGGWDRFMRPGPGSPALADLRTGPPRPCVVQQVVRLRQGARHDYAAWFAEQAAPAVTQAGWQPMMWLVALHGSLVTTLVAAPDWSGLHALADALPEPDPAWQAQVQTSALCAWGRSGYLQR